MSLLSRLGPRPASNAAAAPVAADRVAAAFRSADAEQLAALLQLPITAIPTVTDPAPAAYSSASDYANGDNDVDDVSAIAAAVADARKSFVRTAYVDSFHQYVSAVQLSFLRIWFLTHCCILPVEGFFTRQFPLLAHGSYRPSSPSTSPFTMSQGKQIYFLLRMMRNRVVWKKPRDTSTKPSPYVLRTASTKQLKQVNLATNLIRSFKGLDLPSLEEYPISHVVSYKYYMGVLAFYDEQYKKAKEDLNFCLENFPASSNDTAPQIESNKILLLTYLVPVNLMAGIAASQRLFGISPILRVLFEEIQNAVGKGMLGLFDKLLEEKRKILIDRDVYLAIERCRLICFRNLARRT
ncbi:COP9 signalosome (CSN) subunit [Entophlyctis sp. JEL0112]|nr:COP9 signalosome (CSN) subunit [Entophlyctis sp. JEL0112]